MPTRRLATGLIPCALTLSIAAACFPSNARSEDAELGQRTGSFRAVLIGVEHYQRIDKLPYTTNDVNQLAGTLRKRGGYADVVSFVEPNSDPTRIPSRDNLLKNLPKELARATLRDRVLVYFSGHGLLGKKDGNLYLLPSDVDPANPEPTAIPASWLRRQLASCQAHSTLLVIDACHAGNAKGDFGDSVTGKALRVEFENLPNVVTLASSSGDQKSRLWPARRQSLFSCFLNQGLKGHADTANADGSVDVLELHRFVHDRVTRVAQALGYDQNPLFISNAGISKPQPVIDLQPYTLDGLLAEMADQLAIDFSQRHLPLDDASAPKIGVLEFINGAAVEEILGADFGILGKHAADQFEERLVRHNRDAFTVVDRRGLRDSLAELDFSINDLAKPDRLADLAQRMNGMPLLAIGTFRHRDNRMITLRCQLFDIVSRENVAIASGTALLNENEWGMVGRSAWLTADRRQQLARPVPDSPVVPTAARIAMLDHVAETAPHPLLPGGKFPLNVKIMVVRGEQREERRPEFEEKTFFKVVDGKQSSRSVQRAVVNLRKGEEYEIWIENELPTAVTMRLLVDGLNTLPETDPDTGMLLPMQRVSLNQARHWLLHPDEGRKFAVRGFFENTAANAQVRRFEVTSAPESLAARKGFAEQAGIITAAFYLSAGGRGPTGTAVGTIPGRRLQEQLKSRKGFGCDELLGVVHIHYVDRGATR